MLKPKVHSNDYKAWLTREHALLGGSLVEERVLGSAMSRPKCATIVVARLL